MSGTLRTVLLVVGALVLGYFAINLVIGLVKGLLSLLIPVLIIGGIAYALYVVFNRKALGGSRRTLP
jgi:hypothetical protein